MSQPGRKLRILFLCTGNSCRSQMAEAWARTLKGDAIAAASAGVAPQGIDRRAIKAMAEVGVDISSARPKHVDEFEGQDFDIVITVCSDADEKCPAFPGKTRIIHVGFDDPPRLASSAQDEEEALAHYRRVRDEIKAFVESLPQSIEEGLEIR
ncbi:arsenate reductase ArsC [Acidobacteriota bacterium]